MTEAVVAHAHAGLHADPDTPRGDRVWDRWFDRALAEGVRDDLAALGRAVMHQAWTRPWDDAVRSACGYYDDGAQMIALAVEHPQRAERTWSHLLETDGNVAVSAGEPT